ncbi:MAG TPA: amidohydrolase [Candidatus Limnocylindrales bacterium]|nr:amidohydrolase [Candidatus Limnocylindrales bacterium]
MPDHAPADLVFLGGSLLTIAPAGGRAAALAIREGRITAVGSDAAVRQYIGPKTRVIELDGRTVLPGFQDAHVHPIGAGLEALRCSLHEHRGLDAYLAAIKEYAARRPNAEWITGGGWSLDDFPGGTPRAEDLDRVIADRPTFLPNRDGHGAWVNSLALERAGITAETPDPPDGRIERNPDGSPSGTLHEGAAELVERLIPKDTEAEMLDALAWAQAALHRLGITAWQDAWVLRDMIDVYRRFAEQGRLTARVIGAHWWDRTRGPEQMEPWLALREAGAMGRFTVTSVKLMLDGIVENFTAAMSAPYLDAGGKPTPNSGIDFIAPDVLADAVTRIDALGFQPHFHAIGDRAVHNALDAVAAARAANGPSDTRPHVAHIQVIHPEDIGRFGPLGMVANAQPYWAVHEGQMDRLTIPFLGQERSTWQYPFGSLLLAGARLAMGSDWSVSTADPLVQMEVAINRVSDLHRDHRPFLPDERLTLDQALTAFTIGSAYVNHLDEDTGTLEAGKLADLVVLDRDITSPEAGPLGDARVIATFVEGEAVFDALPA